LIAICLSAYGIDKGIASNFLAALQFGENAFAPRVERDSRYFLPQAEGDSGLAQVVEQRLNNFSIDEVKK
jgi:hypothetical protein